jgi:hypothetical protein
LFYLLFQSYWLVLNIARWETRHDDADDSNHNKLFKLGRIVCESAANEPIVCVLRIIILIAVHVDPVALIERANVLVVLRINFN